MPRNPGIPRYRQIAESLLATLPGRGQTPGVRIPSETAVVLRFKCGKNTARRALDFLKDQGFITRHRGSGSLTTGKTSRSIAVFGYFLSTGMFPKLFSRFGYLVSLNGYRLVLHDLGLKGEHLGAIRKQCSFNAFDAAVFLVPSHPQGVEAAANIRRRLPKRMPMVCIADPLHLSLQGGGRFDLVMWDYGHALEKMLDRFAAEGIHHPVYVNLSDTGIESQRLARIAFMGHLAARGAANPSDFIWPWNNASAHPAEAWRERQKALGWAPDAYILEYPWERELRAQCRKSGFPIAAKTPVWAFDDSTGKHHLPMSIRAMADVCAELLLSRLRTPSRPNLVVQVNVPVRRRPPKPPARETSAPEPPAPEPPAPEPAAAKPPVPTT